MGVDRFFAPDFLRRQTGHYKDSLFLGLEEVNYDSMEDGKDGRKEGGREEGHNLRWKRGERHTDLW